MQKKTLGFQNKVLNIFTQNFPNTQNEHSGIFIKDQVIELSKHFDSINLYVFQPILQISKSAPFVTRNKFRVLLTSDLSENVNVRKVGYLPFPHQSKMYYKSILFSARRARVVGGKNLVNTLFPLGAVIKSLNATYSVVVHGSDFRAYKSNPALINILRDTINSANKVITVSEGLEDEIYQFCGELENTLTVHNGVKLNLDGIQKLKTPDKFKFIYVGALIQSKGIYELISAFERLQLEEIVELIIVGDGPLRIFCEQKANEYEGISCLGALDNEDVLEQMKMADSLVLPSYKEGFGRVLIEMMNFGKPVVSTLSGGPENIVDKRSGILVSPKDDQQLFQAMYQIMKKYEDFDSKEIQSIVEDKFNLEKQAFKLVSAIV